MTFRNYVNITEYEMNVGYGLCNVEVFLLFRIHSVRGIDSRLYPLIR